MVTKVSAVSAQPKVGGHGGVRATKKTGKVTRTRREPGTMEGVGRGFGQSLDSLLDSLMAVGRAVYEFLGRVFNTIYEWCATVISWIGDCIKAAAGKTREAFEYVRSVISAKNVDWIKVHTNVVKALCAAAAVGLGVTGGLLVGGTVAGIAVTAGASVSVAKMTGILATAVTGGVLGEACFTFLKAGVHVEQIAEARTAALAKSKGQKALAVATA